jgi:hypothetical protein
MKMVGLMYYIGQGNWGGPKGQISLTRSQQLFSYIM